MKRRAVALTSVGVLALLIVFSIFLATRHVAPGASQINSPLLGRPAPTFSGRTLQGKPFSLSQERGKIVVLNFWASWCTPCKQEAPELSSFAWEHRHDGVVVVGVVWNDSLAAARQFELNYGSLYPSVIDSDGQIANSFGVTSPPTIFLLDTHGRVAETLIGATTNKQLSAAVRRIRLS